MKKLYTILISLLIITASLWSVYRFSGLFSPKMTLSVLQINRIGADEASLKVKVDLKNRSPLSVSFKDINFRVKADGQTLIETDTVVPVSMKSFKTSSFIVPVNVKLSQIKSLNIEKTKEKQDSCIYHFRLEVINEPSFFLPDTFFINTEEKLPLYQLPEVVLTKMEPIEYLAPAGPRYNLTLKVKNKNLVPLVILDPQYMVTFEGEDVLIEGTYPKDLVVPPKSDKILVLPVQMKKETIFKHVNKIIFNKEELGVNLIFKGNIKTKSQYIEDCNLVVKVNGSLKELINDN